MVLPTKYEGGTFKASYLPHWEYLGMEMLEPDAASMAANPPSQANIVQIRARGGDIYFQFNLGFANANSMYLPQNAAELIGPLSNLNALHVYGAAAAYAHIMYFRETEPLPQR